MVSRRSDNGKARDMSGWVWLALLWAVSAAGAWAFVAGATRNEHEVEGYCPACEKETT